MTHEICNEIYISQSIFLFSIKIAFIVKALYPNQAILVSVTNIVTEKNSFLKK